MPWSINKRGNEYCVVKDSDGEVEGCHDTREQAARQIAALNASEDENKGEAKVEEDFRGLEGGKPMLPDIHDVGKHEGYVPKPGLPPEHVENMALIALKLKKLSKVIFKEHFVPIEGERFRMDDEEFNLQNLKSADRLLGEALEMVDDDRIARLLNTARDHVKEAIGDYPEVTKKDAPKDEGDKKLPPGLPFLSDDEEIMELLAAGKKEEFQWEGPIVFEGVLTGDNRLFKPGSITWDSSTLPWPFRWQKESTKGHDGAVAIGRVDRLERREDGSIYGFGAIVPSLNEEAAEYLRLLEAGVASGVSVDGDSAEFDVQESAEGDSRIEFSSMRLRSLTAVDVPAFNKARIDLEAADEDDEERKKRRERSRVVVYGEDEVEELGGKPSQGTPKDKRLHDNNELAEDEKKRRKKSLKSKVSYALTAAAIPVQPKTEWFADPKFDNPTPITVTEDGHVYGHLALFDTCHIGLPGCVTPPKGSDYKFFHTGEVETDVGESVEVGHLTFNTGHAGMSDSAKAAAAHYDHTGTVAADVRAGEDEHGIWVAGALRPSLSDEDIRAFRAAPLSGDWRRIAGKLEMVGALAVNVPGFPVPRTRTLVASGETETLLTFQDSEDSEEERLEKRDQLKSKVL